MTDLAVLAVGFGVIPLAAILLYALLGLVMQHREASWGFLAGVLAFLGVSHAMAAVLVHHSLFDDPVVATAVSFAGLAAGAGIAWLLLLGPFIRTEPHRMLAATTAFLGLHSLADGLVLGTAFISGVVPTMRIDAVTVSATVVHRFLEGCMLVIPAIWASWKPRQAFAALLVSLASHFAVSGRVPAGRAHLRQCDGGLARSAVARPSVPPHGGGRPWHPLARLDRGRLHRNQPRAFLRRVTIIPRRFRKEGPRWAAEGQGARP